MKATFFHLYGLSTLHLIPFFLAFAAAAFLSATILQAMFDDLLKTLKPMR